jgi:hypothetical protein
VDKDLKAKLEAALPAMRELHRKAPDAIILVADLSCPEGRECADRMDSRLVEKLLAQAAKTGTAPLFFTTLAKHHLDGEDAEFFRNTPPGQFGVMVFAAQDLRAYLPE